MSNFTSHLYSNSLPLKCEYLPHSSLPLERKLFLIHEYPMVESLELNCDFLNHLVIGANMRALVPCTTMLSLFHSHKTHRPSPPFMDSPARRLSIQEVPMPMDLPPPSYSSEPFTKLNLALIPIVVKSRGLNTDKIFTNWSWATKWT